MENRRVIPFIDAARAIAPLFVLWAHLGPWWCMEHVGSCTNAAGSLWSPVADTMLIASLLPLNGNGGHLGVLLFFLVSGFIISHVAHTEGRLEFVIKRVFRLVPLLVVASVIAYLLSGALVSWGLPPTLGFGAQSFSDLLLSIFLLNTVLPSPTTLGVTWSLVPEVSFYALLTMAWSVRARWPLGGTYLMIALVALLKSGTLVFVSFRPAHSFITYVEFILIGRAIYLAWAGLISYRAAALLASIALAANAALHFLDAYERSLLFGARSVVPSWAVAIALFIALMSGVTRCPRVLRFLSDRSYSIYLLHIPIGSLVLSVLCLRYGVPVAWGFAAALAAIFAVSHVTYRLVEIPGQRVGRQILRRLRSSATRPMEGRTMTALTTPP